MSQDPEQLRRIIEGALLAAGRPLDLRQLQQLFQLRFGRRTQTKGNSTQEPRPERPYSN